MVYQESLALGLADRGIPFEREVLLPIKYKGRVLQTRYFSDFVCDGEAVVECKALAGLTGTNDSQAINYLKATGLSVALLLNFGTPSLQYKRLVN